MGRYWVGVMVWALGWSSAALFVGCEGAQPSSGEQDAAQVGRVAAAASKCSSGVNGDIDYCDLSCLCGVGEGDCDGTATCQAGFVCRANDGPNWGLPVGIDVCVGPTCGNGLWDGTECGVDCGTTDCAPCASPLPTKTCGGVLGGSHYCNNPNQRCALGEGDCDNNGHCQPGLVCGVDKGPRFGLPAGTDACVGPTCGNRTWDSTECGVDCGGTAGCGSCVVPILSKTCGGVAGGGQFCDNPFQLCAAGEGDCDSNAQCAGGLVCAGGVAGKYGYPGTIEVCTPPSCINNILDAGEAGIDCGGTSQCGACAGTGTPQWSFGYGDGLEQELRAIDVDSAGNVWVAGFFRGAIDLGGGPLVSAGGRDVFLAKLDPSGAHLFSQRFGNASEQLGLGLAVDSGDNVILIGYFNGDINLGGATFSAAMGQLDVFVGKFNSGGAHVWSHRFGDAGADQQGWAVEVNASNDVFIAGHYRGTIDLGGGNLPSGTDWNVFLAKLTAGGVHQWSQGFGSSSGQQFCRSLDVDSAGNVAISGQFTDTVNFGGNTLSSMGNLDAYAAKLTGAGVHVWSRSWGDAQDQHARRIQFDSAGAVVVLGYFQGAINAGCQSTSSAGGFDTSLIKLSATGSCVWQRRFGDAADQYGDALAIDNLNRILIGGDFSGTLNFLPGPITSAGGRDGYLASFKTNGAPTWTRRFGDGADQHTLAIGYDSGNNIFAGGYFAGSGDFGTGSLMSNGELDAWLGRYSP